jgi:hypothetical protein
MLVATAVVSATNINVKKDIQVTASEDVLGISPLGTNAVVWSKTYGGSEFDEFRDVQQTTDGGYIACGETEVSNNFYPWVLKVDAAGNEEWNWTLTQFYYNETYYDIIDTGGYSNCIKQVSDGGYVVCLQMTFMSDTEELNFGGLAKLNATGVEQWVQIYAEDFSWTFYPDSVIIENDGFVIVGCSGAPQITNLDLAVCILKTNANGVEQWHQEWQYGPLFDQGWAVCHTTDNGYLVTGYFTISSTLVHSFMIKTDANGNEQWNKTFGGSKSDFFQSRNCYQTPDSGYIMGGYTYSYGAGSDDVWIVKTDSSGMMEWNKTFGDKKSDFTFGFVETNDDGYVICRTNNYTSPAGDKEDIFLIKIDENGNTKWVQKFGGPGIQLGTGISNTHEGGFIVSGRTGAYQVASSDGLLVKFAPIDITVDIKGGLGIKATIKNNGIANLTNVSYELQVKGGILGRINKTITGWINISAGETIPLEKIMVFGLGSITITAKVADEEQTATGMQLIIFSMVKK